MIRVKSKYLMKCEMIGCDNPTVHSYIAGVDNAKGMAICDKCVMAMYSLLKSKKSKESK